jgi:hypothetical protein
MEQPTLTTLLPLLARFVVPTDNDTNAFHQFYALLLFISVLTEPIQCITSQQVSKIELI